MAGGLYPDDTAAHKAAALEIAAMNAVVRANHPQVTVPLTAMYLICGQCVIASARAPVDRNSLVYGCDNAGNPARVVEDGSRLDAVVPIVRDLATSLGLAEHSVTSRGRRAVKLCLPIDTEVHVGSDDRIYVIDLARLMPPVPPPEADRTASYLHRHFRPEFMRRYPHLRLSSDAFSPFAASHSSEADGEGTFRAHARVRELT